MPSFKRGTFKGEKNVAYLESELKALVRIYTPSTMLADEMTEFKNSMKSIEEDFQKFEGYSLETFYKKVIERQKQYDPQFIEPDF